MLSSFYNLYLSVQVEENILMFMLLLHFIWPWWTLIDGNGTGIFSAEEKDNRKKRESQIFRIIITAHCATIPSVVHDGFSLCLLPSTWLLIATHLLSTSSTAI